MIRLIDDSSALFSIREGLQHYMDIALLSVIISGQSYREYE